MRDAAFVYLVTGETRYREAARGRTLPEIAELCGCSLATVKRRLS